MRKLCIGILCLLLAGLCACAGQAAPDTAAGTVAQATVTQAPTEPADYFDMVWGWACPAGKYAQYIEKIYHTESGTAGSSGKAAISAVALLEFSKAVAGDPTQDLAPVFASMNDSQARFFAFQWIRLRALADRALSDPQQFHAEFDWAGLEEFDAAQYSFDAVEDLEGVIDLLLCREEMR